MNMDNMRYYNRGREVPKEAMKQFSNGRFSGTDINPMWRIKTLTEMFGPCGIGWYTEVTRQDTVPVDDGNLMVFVDLNLYVKEGDEWSKPIFGTGGNTLKMKGKGDDEGYKKAYTDAMSIACKALGIGADVWYANDTTSKYSDKYVDDAPKGSTEAAQEAGEKRLRQIEAEMAAKRAADEPKPVKGPATDDQRAWIRDNADDETYINAMQAFGTDLERMTFGQASKLIKRIQDGGAA